ncbi:retrotransposon protein, putative, ty1-copia subclass [Tanacetum coccineum]
MAQPDNNNTLSSAFKTFFEREKLTGDNFNDWYHSLRIVLRVAGTYDYLFKPCPKEPPAENVKAAWKAEYKIHSDVACLMFGRMSPAFQRQFELYFPQAMRDELRRMFVKPKAVEIYDMVDTLHSCKQALEKSVSAHVLEMKGYMDQLQALGKPYDNDMAINLINMSHNKDFVDFVRNFNMHCMGKTLVTGRGTALFTSKSCAQIRTRRLSMVLYLQGFRVKRKLSYGEKYLHVGNGAQAAVEAIGVFNLVLPSGLVLSLNNCHYAPSIVIGLQIHVNGVFEIDMNDNVSKYNNNSIFSINKKRKLDLNSSYLWHCRLAHIGKTRMQKLQREGLLESINDGSYDKCESCISGKMTKKPFNNNIERATDLLGLELCPLIGVSERRNRTLLDMVRSMFNLTTLPLSFWDYALESAVRILNMVPTKKIFLKEISYLKNSVGEIMIWKNPVEPESLGPPPELIPIRRSERNKSAPNRLNLNIEVEDDVVGDLGEPANYKAAMLDPDKVIWQGAMDEEMNSMKVNEVWIEVDPPSNAKVVRSKWLFKKKTDMDAIRILIAIAAYYDYEIWQMDVKTAFLNGRLDEDIYMEQPEGYNKRFDEEIKKFGFTQNRDEPCVYRKASGSNVVFLILYVDDILIMGNNIPRLKEVKDYLGKCFSMKDLGEDAYILGIKIYRDRSKPLIGLSQSAYIDKILKKFNMHNSKKGYLPMEVKHELSNEMCASTPEEVAYMKKVPYASAVGSIMYAVRCTRPDVAFAQNLVSRYQQNPGKLHWVAVKHILKYLRNTRDMFLVYGGKPDTELNVTGFCDASWQCDKDDTKSQTGYVFVVNGGAVDWKSKKQTTIAMSATQAEYMAASEAAMEACFGLGNLLEILE